MNVPVAANVLGTLGAVCWSVQLIPQIIVNYRRHDTTGLQPTMMLLWASAGVPLGVYNIVENFNIALQIQPQILTFLSLLTWAQCKYYRGTDVSKPKWSVSKCVAVVMTIGVFMGGIEVALVFALRIAKNRGVDWPSKLMGALSGFLLCAGVARHYWDIYKERTVRGISFIFVAIDAMGDLTSLLSIFFEPRLDILGLVIYGSELALWLGVLGCGGYYNLTPWLRSVMHKDHIERAAVHDRDASHASGERHRPPSTRSDSVSSTVFRTASGSSVTGHTSSVEDHLRDGLRLRDTILVQGS